MTIGGIDEGQARKVGNFVRIEGVDKVLIDGSTGKVLARVPSDAAAARALRTAAVLGEVVGNCGRSHMFLRDLPQNDLYQFKTGFNLNGNAYDFEWRINIHAEQNNRIYNFDWEDTGPKWPSPDWTSGWKDDDTPLNTFHTARVTYGAAWLTDGRICYSGFPTDNRYVS